LNPQMFSTENNEYQSCRTHHSLQLLYWSSFHLINFGQLKFWISNNNDFKPDYEALNDLSWKSLNIKVFQLMNIYNFYLGYFFIWQSVRTHYSQNLHLLCSLRNHVRDT
jgi:hypothetical protein